MIERFYKPDSNFVFIKLGADVDDRQLLNHMVEYNIEARDREGLQELCDCRNTYMDKITVQGCVKSAKLDVGQKRAKGGKLAIWVSTELQYGMSRAFQMIAHEESIREIAVFYEFKEAVEFLDIKETVPEIVDFIEETGNSL